MRIMHKWVIVFIGLLFFSLPSYGADVRVFWDGSASETDGAVGYRVYYGNTTHAGIMSPTGPFATPGNSAPYDFVVDVSGGAVWEKILMLGAGAWFFRVTAYDEAGRNAIVTSGADGDSTTTSSDSGLELVGGLLIYKD